MSAAATESTTESKEAVHEESKPPILDIDKEHGVIKTVDKDGEPLEVKVDDMPEAMKKKILDAEKTAAEELNKVEEEQEPNVQLEPWVLNQQTEAVEMTLEEEEDFQPLTKEEAEARIKQAEEAVKEDQKEKEAKLEEEKERKEEPVAAETTVLPAETTKETPTEVVKGDAPVRIPA